MISITSPIQSWIQQFSTLSNDDKYKYLATVDRRNKEKLLKVLQVYSERQTHRFYKLFPDKGELRRELYKKHTAFFDAGTDFTTRLFMAGNRVGKTIAGSYEATLHATGLYPHWWTGKRFDHKTEGWVSGKTNETTRDIIQKELFGNVVYVNGKKTIDGTGTIPKHLIDRFNIRWKSGVADLIDTVRIKHVSGEWSTFGLKSYQQGRGAFEGTAKHWIWLDEEPPLVIYTECVTRTATTQGVVLVTFTPLDGTTPMIDDFIAKADEGVNFLARATWDDAPHLTEADKERLLAIFPKHEHDARAKGIPMAGSGLIFQVDENLITCEPFDIPAHWLVITGIDFGWDHPTAATALALDRDTDTVYVFDEYKASEKTPAQHAPHIKAMCHWSPVAYPHDGMQHDKGSGQKLRDLYEDAGLNMLHKHATFSDGSNGVEAGLMMMLTMMEEGRWKVFNTCEHWLEERRGYHRKEGKVVKLKDDVISSSRYALMMIVNHGITKPRDKSKTRSRSKL